MLVRVRMLPRTCVRISYLCVPIKDPLLSTSEQVVGARFSASPRATRGFFFEGPLDGGRQAGHAVFEDAIGGSQLDEGDDGFIP